MENYSSFFSPSYYQHISVKNHHFFGTGNVRTIHDLMLSRIRPLPSKSSICLSNSSCFLGLILYVNLLGKIELKIMSISCWISRIGDKSNGISFGITSLNSSKTSRIIGGGSLISSFLPPQLMPKHHYPSSFSSQTRPCSTKHYSHF